MERTEIRGASRTEGIVEEEQFVTFVIQNEIYGVPVLKVQEIIGMTKITNVPNTLAFMKGVINLRGTVVPVIDMRIKFEMEEVEFTNFTVIIIVEVQNRLVGMIVDSVADVLNIPVNSIQGTPQSNTKINTDFIMGIGQKDDKLIIILDAEKILTSEELEMIESGE